MSNDSRVELGINMDVINSLSLFHRLRQTMIKNPSIVNGAISTTPTVIVQGDFVNTSNGVYIGSITNTGEWWITGNYTQNSSATLSDNGDIGFTGGNGTPSTTNRLKQTISGTSTLTGANAFYNFIIKNLLGA